MSEYYDPNKTSKCTICGEPRGDEDWETCDNWPHTQEEIFGPYLKEIQKRKLDW